MRGMRGRENFTGAITVMENYLDGALADIDQGTVENLSIAISCMKAIIALNPTYGLMEYGDKLIELIDKEEKQ